MSLLLTLSMNPGLLSLGGETPVPVVPKLKTFIGVMSLALSFLMVKSNIDESQFSSVADVLKLNSLGPALNVESFV